MKLYLSSYEYKDFEIPREVIYYHKTKLDDRNVLMIEVNEPLIGQKYGWGGKDISKFYITNRFSNDRSLMEHLDKFPIHVYILISKTPGNIYPSSLSELENIAWACLYDNEEDARNHKIV